MISCGPISSALAINSSRQINVAIEVVLTSTSPAAMARDISLRGHPRSTVTSAMVTCGRWCRKMVRMRLMTSC